MMDDDFNVLGSLDDEPLNYGGEVSEMASPALAALNFPPGKRRRFPNDENLAHPIDWHMRMDCGRKEADAKRARIAEDEAGLDRLTGRIMEARKRRREEKRQQEVEDEEEEEMEQVMVMRLPPCDGSTWIGVSSEDNSERLYIRLSRHHGSSAAQSISAARAHCSTSCPLDGLMKEASFIRDNRRLFSMDEGGLREIGNHCLWVDKYSPRGYAQLLSDTQVNRHVMTWLRLWDECVLGKQSRLYELNLDEKEAIALALDDSTPRRPIHKVLVMSGPAGVGKTTLCGVLARQAGYAVTEVNASDSRTAADMERVLEAVGRSSRSLANGLPHCLILDEIDGAPADTIRVLVKAVTATGRHAIRRPIIAICNRLYTPSLRELRPIAFNIQIQPSQQGRIEERLKEICRLEGVGVEGGLISQLVRLCHADLRLSLNTLQWVAAAARARHSAVSVEEITHALEQTHLECTNPFLIWSTVLEYTRHHDCKGVLRPAKERLRAVESIARKEDCERLAIALHHNYTRIPSLTTSAVLSASSCFVDIDMMWGRVQSRKDWRLCRYIPASFSSLHIAVASHVKPQLQFPSSLQQQQQRLRESQDTVSRMRAALLLSSSACLLTDTLPLAVICLQPIIRTTNAQLYTKKDMEMQACVVTALRHYRLTFLPTTVDGNVHYIFSPPIDVLTMFELTDTAHRHLLSNASRKLLAHQVALADMRGSLGGRSGGAASPSASAYPTPSTRTLLMIPRRIQFSTPNLPLHYRFNNCYSNAVKRRVRISQLLA